MPLPQFAVILFWLVLLVIVLGPLVLAIPVLFAWVAEIMWAETFRKWLGPSQDVDELMIENKKPRDDEAFILAQIHEQRGEYDAAIPYYDETERASERDTVRAAALYSCGRCWERIGEEKAVEKAKAKYRKLLQWYPSSDQAPLAQRRLAELEGETD